MQVSQEVRDLLLAVGVSVEDLEHSLGFVPVSLFASAWNMDCDDLVRAMRRSKDRPAMAQPIRGHWLVRADDVPAWLASRSNPSGSTTSRRAGSVFRAAAS